jgi:hypothetical protein
MGDIPLAWGIDYRFENFSGDDLVIYASIILSRANGTTLLPLRSFPFCWAMFMDIGLRYENWDVDDGKDESEFTPKISFYHQDAVESYGI